MSVVLDAWEVPWQLGAMGACPQAAVLGGRAIELSACH